MISVIIPSYNRPNDLKRCLASIRTQGHSDNEILVVDDNSTEDLAELVDRGEIYLRNKTNYGPAYSRNFAFEHSRGDILLFLDSDSELRPGVLHYIERALTRDSSIACLGGCGPWDEQTDEVSYLKGKFYDRWGQNKSVQYDQTHFQKQEMIECDHYESACLAVRREVFNEIGGFDPYWFYMGEDREFCLRAKRKGYRNVIAWQARAIHHERDLEVKVSLDRREFFLKRFFEVSLKLDGLAGACRWLYSNRKLLTRNFARNVLLDFAGLVHIYRRRGWFFLDSNRLDTYRERVDAEKN